MWSSFSRFASGTSPSLLEAMSCSNLILAHDNPFNREALGNAGVFFAGEDELTKAIDGAEQDDAIEKKRNAARARARARDRWSDVVASYAELVGQIERRPKAA